ncbi:MAG TPA: M23 family metallopeptidase [Pseudomonadales bacterium]
MCRMFIVALLLLSLPVAATTVYRYQDADGRWHFSDKKPAGNQPVQQQQLAMAQADSAAPRLQVGEDNGEWVLQAINPYPAPVELAFLPVPGSGQAVRRLLPPLSTTIVWRPLTDRRARIEHHFMLGDPAAQADDTAYRVPVPVNGLYRITQAFAGRFSHAEEPNRYAVDIDVPVGTEVLAARDGVVVLVRQNYVLDGVGDYFADKANMIQVLHEDGTLGVYAHLLNDSARVSAGDTVRAGQPLARSGSSGYSTGPHLHFVIWQNTGMAYRSVPFRFVIDSEDAWQPQAGMLLAPPHD